MKATAATVLLLLGLTTLVVGFVNDEPTLTLCASGMCFAACTLFLAARNEK